MEVTDVGVWTDWDVTGTCARHNAEVVVGPRGVCDTLDADAPAVFLASSFASIRSGSNCCKDADVFCVSHVGACVELALGTGCV